jgi:UPF0716 family protein affecting phage T7 exclusion
LSTDPRIDLMGLIVLLIPVLEITALYQASLAYGFLNLVFFLIIKGMIGKLIMRRAAAIGNSLGGQQQQQKLVSAVSNGLAGFLISLPTLIISFIGFLLLLPPTRWVLTKMFKNLFAKISQSGNFKVFTNTSFGQNFNGFGPKAFSNQDRNSSNERDVTPQIIDVRPIPIKDKKDSE